MKFRLNTSTITKRLTTIVMICLAAALAMPAAAQRRKATKARPTLEALFDTADQALVMYDTEALSDAIDEIAGRLDSARKPAEADTERLRQLRNRQLALDNMLSRVQQLVIVDSVTVSLDSMLTRYALSADAGTLRADTGLVSFTPAGAREIFFTERDADGLLHIMAADIPDNGVPEKARQLKLFDDPDVQTAWPFLMADGSTLYFASDADTDGSLGGWDIYMTRRDETGEFLEPTNIGMPYNSTGDDMMLVIDEYAGLGYWATDRNAGDGDVTVFTFVPSDARVNYSADRPDISDLAYVTSVKATWPEGFDPRAVLDKAAKARAEHSAASASRDAFALSLGDGRVVTDPSQLRSSQAKALVKDYESQRKTLADAENRLAGLRTQYGRGNKSVANEILSLERQLPAMRARLKNAANAIIRAEAGR